MRKGIIYLLTVGAILVLMGCSGKMKADLIVHNGTIYTVDGEFTVTQAMALKDGRIMALGSSQLMLDSYKAPTTIDLQGKFVYPGFIDPHSHFVGYADNLLRANLWMSTSMEEITERLKAHHQLMKGEWLQGRGWDQNLFEVKEMPDNRLLNEAFPDIPVYIIRVDGHAALANDKALEMAGINADTKIEGGEIRIVDGKPSGLLIDKAMYLVSSLIPKPTAEEKTELLKRAQQDMFAVGLTSVCDAGLSKESILFLDSLHKAGELDVRVYAMLNPTEENFTHFLPQGPYITDHLTVRSVKLFADGALGSRGALMKEPYSDDPANTGILVNDIEMMRKTCELALMNGFQVITHCIGDQANHIMLNMYADYLEPENDLRWRIEHAQVIDPADFDLFGKYNIIPSIQAIHAVSDMGWAEDRVGSERIKGAYAYRDLMNQVGWLPNGSDFPVEYINPLYSYHAAFTRTDRHGNPKGGWYPEQLLTREEALKGMTIWAAKANFEEDTRGSLESGKFADFVVMDADLLTVDESLIYDLPVLETWISGKQVFEKETE
ncbi:MAG: amidohydrolase [Bacteroidota bacterium]